MPINYLIESKYKFEYHDFQEVRETYQPIIGIQSSALYQYLIDNISKSSVHTSVINLKYISKVLGINNEEFDLAKKTLEAIGLMYSYVKVNDNNSKTFIFEMNKPLNKHKFNSNKLLSSQLKDKIGDEEYKLLFFPDMSKTFNKAGYEDISATYFDVFDIKSNSEEVINDTQELKIPKTTNKKEAIEKLSPQQFYKYISNSEYSPSFNQLVDSLNKQGFSNKCINIFMNYSFDVNKKIVNKYISTIADSFFKRGIINNQVIQEELDKSFKSRNPKKPILNKETKNRTFNFDLNELGF